MLKILVKLPNKLGDTIMATSFLMALSKKFPGASIDIIILKGISELQQLLPGISDVHEFSKKEHPGITGKYRFGKMISNERKYDLFFCLPFSVSSALIGYFTGSKKRIGHNTEHRGLLLTDKYALPQGLHVVEDYIDLLNNYLGEKISFDPPKLEMNRTAEFKFTDNKYIVINACSGPPSRYIPVGKVVSIIKSVKAAHPYEIVLTGAPNEKDYVNEIASTALEENGDKVINLAGKTSIVELGWVLKKAELVITTDSGNAHYANSLGTKTVVLFGPGLQSRCHPYDKDIMRPLQLDLECVPCRKETCKFGDNRCLAGIENGSILNAMEELISN